MEEFHRYRVWAKERDMSRIQAEDPTNFPFSARLQVSMPACYMISDIVHTEREDDKKGKMTRKGRSSILPTSWKRSAIFSWSMMEMERTNI